MSAEAPPATLANPATGLLNALGLRTFGAPSGGRESLSHLAMTLACSLGMLAGLSIDALEGRLATFSALCITGDRDLLYWMQMHYQQLPAMHLGMLVAMLVAIPSQRTSRGLAGMPALLLKNIGCLGTMWLGMTVGALALHPAEGDAASVAMMLGGMAAGMLFGLQLGIVGTGCLFAERGSHRLPAA